MGIILFLLFGYLVIFSGHYWLYRTVVKFIVLGKKAKRSIAILLTVLSVSFLPSMLLVRWNETVVTKGINYLAGVWIGIFTNLVLALVVFWVLFGIAKFFKTSLNWKLVATVLFIMVLGVAGWGLYSATHPIIRPQTLSVQNMPEAWKGKRIVHISDLHLGLSNNAQFGERIVSMVHDQQPDIIFITGDLFDGGEGRLDQYVSLLNKLKAPGGSYFITGNHETYTGVQEIYGVVEKAGITVLKNTAVEVEGVLIIGVQYPERGVERDMEQVMRGLVNAQQPQLLLFHSPTRLKEFEQAGIDMIFSGHTHRGQLFPFGFITRWVYDGYDRGLNQYGSMQLYVSSGTATWGPPMKTSGRTEIAVFEVE